MMNNHIVAIIGAGHIGQAITQVLRPKENIQVRLWDTDASKVPDQQSLPQTLKGANIVFLCCNSWAARAALQSLSQHVSLEAVIASPIKGLEDNTLYTIDQIIRDVLPRNPLALVNGPMLSGEMMDDHPSFAMVASDNIQAREVLIEVFFGTTLHLQPSEDVHGTALAGVLKNVYSIGLGMTAAMEMGSNFRGWFVSQAVREMADIIQAQKGNRETAFEQAGLGDLVATGFSPLSRNCQAGQELVQSGECITVSEGAMSLPALLSLLNNTRSQYPIVDMLGSVVVEKQAATERLLALLKQ
ncbi:MAG: NAD(P)H-dependent glycerol-3-phosphate dehydrogenase [Candidatus Andersenbacteria bacterium]